MTTPDEDPKFVRPFADFLRELNKGRVHEELTQGLHDVVEAVKATGKSGTLTLKLKVAEQKNTVMLTIEDDVVVNPPKASRQTSLWFVDKDGNVSRSDPSQLDFSSIQAVPSVPATPPAVKEA
ncbi:Uncharacterised protein [Mycobacteroides abscessus subsp. massiliense]|uniref:hypothetical protein n=1 Tax=Mycobacteroides abscessus TaxID=36809 RepID=UPI0009A5CA1C|nr:hypothetical protein [Mycobacteroides abscessus]SKM82331.1 Uncharacterised protein [Mycobacteroides abscessus subsp. massiliense]SKM99025.1 Uncharacterised protein [Mycobacteroides abscessus subsp. massiliense]SKN77650.1 Uncharacterised protein [Mycobacteroides abscessus subsp. massiliense]SKN95584.1 Uncharacterised protein [Mycobacteroides abscessus subsp. massiliense]SKO22902.1 Uncharacterised protein [Mycobacteroides abscessus subsp. massiliense]